MIVAVRERNPGIMIVNAILAIYYSLSYSLSTGAALEQVLWW